MKRILALIFVVLFWAACLTAAHATPTPTATATPTATPTPCGANNGGGGATSIVVPAVPTSNPTLNSLVIVALDVLANPAGSFPLVTPPATSGGHPAWNLISLTTVNSPATMEQLLYWHVIGSSETSGAPSFTFTWSGTFQATGVGTVYTGTCTQNSPPCVNPITASGIGTSIASNSVSASAVLVPSGGTVFGAFGTANTGVYFGESGSPSGTVFPSSLTNECSNWGTNAGLAAYDQLSLIAGSYGPFSATLPNTDIADNIAQVVSIAITNPSPTATPTPAATPTPGANYCGRQSRVEG
jgi:hypothetical protein